MIPIMLQYEELRQQLQGMKPDLDDLADALGLKRLAIEVEELEMKAAEPGFWDDPDASQKRSPRTTRWSPSTTIRSP